MKFSAFWSFTLYLGVSTMLKAKRASCVRLERSKRGGKVLCVNWKHFLCHMRELHEVRGVFNSNGFKWKSVIEMGEKTSEWKMLVWEVKGKNAKPSKLEVDNLAVFSSHLCKKKTMVTDPKSWI